MVISISDVKETIMKFNCFSVWVLFSSTDCFKDRSYLLCAVVDLWCSSLCAAVYLWCGSVVGTKVPCKEDWEDGKIKYSIKIYKR